MPALTILSEQRVVCSRGERHSCHTYFQNASSKYNMLAMTVTRTTHSDMYVGSKHFDSRWKRARLFLLQFSKRVARVCFSFPQCIAGTLVGQEHAPTETSRPLSTGPHPCGRLQSFGAARPLLRLSLALGPTVGHTYIPRLQSEGPIGTRFAMAFMYSLSSANTSELPPS